MHLYLSLSTLNRLFKCGILVNILLKFCKFFFAILNNTALRNEIVPLFKEKLLVLYFKSAKFGFKVVYVGSFALYKSCKHSAALNNVAAAHKHLVNYTGIFKLYLLYLICADSAAHLYLRSYRSSA